MFRLLPRITYNCKVSVYVYWVCDCGMGKYGRCRAKVGVSKSVGKCLGCGKEETDSWGSVVTSGSWWHDKCEGVKVAMGLHFGPVPTV
jgi:hypothetical protein